MSKAKVIDGDVVSQSPDATQAFERFALSRWDKKPSWWKEVGAGLAFLAPVAVPVVGAVAVCLHLHLWWALEGMAGFVAVNAVVVALDTFWRWVRR